MSLKQQMKQCSIGLISWPCKSDSKMYILIGEIHDQDICNNPYTLYQFHMSLKFLYPFKIKKTKDKIKIYNEEDFEHFRRTYKMTSQVIFNGPNQKRMVFKSPQLYDMSCMKPLFSFGTHFTPSQHITNPTTNHKVFIVMPYINPVLRGQILDECIGMTKTSTPLFILIGDKHGRNKVSTSTLMKRYLLSRGIKSKNINKSLYDRYPDSILEALYKISFLIHPTTDHDITIACSSTEIRKIMDFVKKHTIIKNTHKKIRFICE